MRCIIADLVAVADAVRYSRHSRFLSVSAAFDMGDRVNGNKTLVITAQFETVLRHMQE